MQFHYMYAPFATDTRRREVWQRLTQIPGIKIEPKLKGLPWFPITTLTDEGRLAQFVEVLSFIVDETLRATEAEAANPPLGASTPGETL